MLEHDLLIFIRKLNQLAAPYMVTGSWASTLYGKPRMTHDVDIIVHLDAAQAARLPELFPLEEFYCPPLEILRQEVQRARKGLFNIIHHASGSKADLYVSKNDSLDQWGFENVRRFHIAGETVLVAPPEYVILGKLKFFREGGSEKHLRDIQSMLAVSSDLIQLPELERMVQKSGLGEAWERAKQHQE